MTIASLGGSSGWGAPRAAHEVALDFLLHAIHTGALAVGEQVSPEAIANQIDLSHVPVREAIKRLEGRGILTHIPRKGHFVTELEIHDIDSMLTLGKLLETLALEYAVPAITDDQIVRLRATIERSRLAVGHDAAAVQAEADEFHAIILERGVPRPLLRQIALLWSGMAAYRHFYYARPEYQIATCDEHAAILAALQKRDVVLAVERFNNHRANVTEATKHVAPFTERTIT